jgi:competence protein ComGC
MILLVFLRCEIILTLMELLVVMAIIVILLALLVSTLKKSKTIKFDEDYFILDTC